ncbi:hypothetical protein [Archangium primigenium]|jgi:hypothetical protein|uniref:hypothetical protein n=1 Tax=[Archangium] primigenium TaxID=2792470 RepID=UPI00195D294A|nr:hypothetical protein [Archangium primigenium]MBM7117840.1 hypothetical protein [Archangium primigenium]
MADPVNPKYLDKRTTERYQRSGHVSEEDYKRHIAGLEDIAEKSVPVETVMQDEEYDLDDEDDEDEDEDDAQDDEDEDSDSAG